MSKQLVSLGEVAKLGTDAIAPDHTASRIARRVMKAVESGHKEYGVRGGILGLIGTTHDPEVYAETAALLEADGIEMEAHRFLQKVPVSFGVESRVPLSRKVEIDIISVTAVDGQPVPRVQEPAERDGHVGQLYPPMTDPSDMHNMSLQP